MKQPIKKVPQRNSSPRRIPLRYPLIANVTTVQIKIGTLADQVLLTVRTAQRRAETQYKWFTRMSYLLYAIGWGLALYAQLHGEELFKVG